MSALSSSVEEILGLVGLSPNEAKVYQSLVHSGRAPVSRVATASGIHRRNVYDTMERLVDKGLVFQVFSQHENLFEAVHPDKLLELMKEREAELMSVLPALRKTYQDKPRTEEVYIYKGVEGFKNYLRDVLRVGEDMYILGAKGFWFDPRIQSFAHAFIKEAKARKIKFYSIFDQEIKSDMASILRTVPKPHRFLPPEYSTHMIVNVFGDRVVTFTGLGVGDLGNKIRLFVTVNDVIAEGYRTWFKFFWDRCSK